MKRNCTFIFFVLFIWPAFGMEKSPRSLRESSFTAIELAQLQDLLYLLKSEASYPNPHAVARIKEAGDKLLKIPNKELVYAAWKDSHVTQTAQLLHLRSAKIVAKSWASPIASCSVMLLEQSYLIALAVDELDQKIAQLNS